MNVRHRPSGSSRLLRRATTAVVAAMLAVLLTPLLASQAVAASYTGTVTQGQMDQYCIYQGTGGGAVLTANNAYGWRCRGGGGVDIGRICSQSGSGPRISRVGNFYDPRSWQCWSTGGYWWRLTRTDFAGYCQRFGYTAAVSGSDAYSWRCSAPNRSDGIAVQNVCNLKIGGSGLVDRFANFYDPNSWECHR